MQRTCAACSSAFQLHPEDLSFLSRYHIPSPTHCPGCRQQRRAAFRNSRNLYRRTCGSSGREIVSIYSPDKPFVVFDPDIWWSDTWDGRDYGREFNFSEPFFPQFARLMRVVPRPALFNKGSENSVFTNHAVYNRNCYMCFNAGYCEDALYSGDVAVKCKDCGDLTNVIEAELLYECLDCTNCYNSSFLNRCSGCSDSRFLFDCRGCTNCVLCVNLRNKSFCINNHQLSREEYEAQIARIVFDSRSAQRQLIHQLQEMVRQTAIHPAIISQAAENVDGDYIFGSKNVAASFDVHNCEDIRHCYDVWDIKDCMDLFQTMDKAEQQYETHACSISTLAFFCNVSHENHDIQYADHCFNSSNLFGCIGLKRQEHCILNRHYGAKEYRALVLRIIEHMRETGEYGEFFPASLSPFGYNETVAVDQSPLTKAQAVQAGFHWSDFVPPPPAGRAPLEASAVPDRLDALPADAKDFVIRCELTGVPFRLTEQELRLYRKLSVPAPTIHPNRRAQSRSNWRNPRRIRDDHCDGCGIAIRTTVARISAAHIMCEQCYLNAIL